MQQHEFRKIVADQANRSLQESGFPVTALPASQLQPLINAIADGVFAALGAIEMDEKQPAQPQRTATAPAAAPAGVVDANSDAPIASAEERPLWRGRPYLTVGTIYELSTQRLRILRGIFSNTVDELELIRVRDTRVTQNLGERILNIGDVTIVSTDASSPEIVLKNVPDAVEVRELIRKAVLLERERRGLRYREDMIDDHGGSGQSA